MDAMNGFNALCIVAGSFTGYSSLTVTASNMTVSASSGGLDEKSRVHQLQRADDFFLQHVFINGICILFVACEFQQPQLSDSRIE